MPHLTPDDLLRPFHDAFKPPSHWRIGVESERFGVHRQTAAPVHYQGERGDIQEVFAVLEGRFGWQPARETPSGPVIALRRGDASITLEPGGQLELSGAPLPDVHQTHRELSLHRSELERLSESIGLSWMGIGFHPLARQSELDWVPKARYAIMREYLAKQGHHAIDMMRRTATVQVNLDYSDETDAMRKLRAALRLSPVVSALFANAPFVEGRLFGGKSYRMRVWLDVDPDRQGLLPRMWNPRATLRDYVEWALDVPMFLFKRDGQVIANTGQSFRSFWTDGYQGHHPTLEDWKAHLNTLFPEVRLKHVLEMRGTDSLPFELVSALPALWTGLLYDPTTLERVEELTSDWSYAEMEALRSAAVMVGLAAPFRSLTAVRLARRLFELAQEGLQRRSIVDPETGRDETSYLEPLIPMLEGGTSPADRLMQGLEGREDLRAEIMRRVRA